MKHYALLISLIVLHLVETEPIGQLSLL